MKNLFYTFMFLGMVTFSCSDEENPNLPEPFQACGVDNVFELPWIAAGIEDLEKSDIGKKYSSLHSAQYGSQTVFYFGSCCPYCSMVPPSLYDCGGNKLGKFGTEGIDWEEITNFEVIWKSSENECIFD